MAAGGCGPLVGARWAADLNNPVFSTIAAPDKSAGPVERKACALAPFFKEPAPQLMQKFVLLMHFAWDQWP